MTQINPRFIRASGAKHTPRPLGHNRFVRNILQSSRNFAALAFLGSSRRGDPACRSRRLAETIFALVQVRCANFAGKPSATAGWQLLAACAPRNNPLNLPNEAAALA